jgi:hypothetical protein
VPGYVAHLAGNPLLAPRAVRLSKKAAYLMHANAVLYEVQQLYNVSDHLDTLADQHPLVSEPLITIPGSVRNTATLFEVLVATKIAPLAGLDPATA